MSLVQISTLGRNGRFGNQLFQYAFARTYAERVGARLETPAWVGQELFGHHEPPISCVLPQLHEGAISSNPAEWVADVDLLGWFQTAHLMACVSRKAVRRWFTFQQSWLDWFPKKHDYYAACHMRQGDFLKAPCNTHYCNISWRSYIRAITAHVPQGCPVVMVQESHPQLCSGLKSELSFLPDFLTLLQANILFRANSTFSWWAGELGNHDAVYSPVVIGLTGPHDVQFVLGNDEQHAPFPGYGKLRFGQE